jgi:hypothetical protein
LGHAPIMAPAGLRPPRRSSAGSRRLMDVGRNKPQGRGHDGSRTTSGPRGTWLTGARGPWDSDFSWPRSSLAPCGEPPMGRAAPLAAGKYCSSGRTGFGLRYLHGPEEVCYPQMSLSVSSGRSPMAESPRSLAAFSVFSHFTACFSFAAAMARLSLVLYAQSSGERSLNFFQLPPPTCSSCSFSRFIQSCVSETHMDQDGSLRPPPTVALWGSSA